MDLKAVIARAFMAGYATSELTVATIFLCIGFTAGLGLYIYIVYQLVNKNAFYNRNFNLSLIELAIITAAIILTVQSNIVVSLGMVGALSIVRFRTAVKDPMDLVFLFWSISVGIICGAGFAMIAVIASAAATAALALVSVFHAERETLILVVNSDAYAEDEIAEVCKSCCQAWRIRARSVTGERTNLAIEVRTREPKTLLRSVTALEHVTSASLLEHDGEVTS